MTRRKGKTGMNKPELCRDVFDILSGAPAGDLPPHLAAHLADCSECRALKATLSAVAEARSTLDPTVHDSLKAGILGSVCPAGPSSTEGGCTPSAGLNEEPQIPESTVSRVLGIPAKAIPFVAGAILVLFLGFPMFKNLLTRVSGGRTAEVSKTFLQAQPPGSRPPPGAGGAEPGNRISSGPSQPAGLPPAEVTEQSNPTGTMGIPPVDAK